MLLRNDLLEYIEPRARTVRVLWIDPGHSFAYVFELYAKGANPEIASVQRLVDDVRSQRARLLLIDPCAAPPDLPLPAKHLQVRDRAWAIVSSLVRDEPGIYQTRARGKLVSAYCEQHAISHPTIYRYLRRYWERGQTREALLPDYRNSGGRGKTRASSADVKRGRPRKSGAGGMNADPEVRQTFRAAVARYAATHLQFSRRGAYRQMIEDYYRTGEADALPSFGQFNYWIEKDLSLPSR